MAIAGMLGSDPAASPGARAAAKIPTASAGGRPASADTAAANPASAPARPRGPEIAVVQKRTGLFAKPGGKRIKTLAPKTEWGNPRVVPILERQGGWLRVIVSDLPNGRTGWIRTTG